MHLVGCLYYLYQWCTVKQISDNEIYLMIKYIKSVLWRVAKRLSYIEEARCLKVNRGNHCLFDYRLLLIKWHRRKPLLVFLSKAGRKDLALRPANTYTRLQNLFKSDHFIWKHNIMTSIKFMFLLLFIFLYVMYKIFQKEVFHSTG